MNMATKYVIIAAVVVAFILVLVLIYVAIFRAQHHKDKHNNNNAVVGMEGIMPEIKRKTSIGLVPLSPELLRAQKFRERARATTIGKPEFKLSKKPESRKDLYKSLGNHPDFLGAAENGTTPRRISDDRTSNCNSQDGLDTPESADHHIFHSEV